MFAEKITPNGVSIATPPAKGWPSGLSLIHICLGRLPEALETLARLERYHPNYAWLYQERGHCYATLRATEPAILAFSRAVVLNSSLPASWNALQVLYRMSGRVADAEQAAANAANLAALPREIVTAFSLYADGDILSAEHVVRQYLLTHRCV